MEWLQILQELNAIFAEYPRLAATLERMCRPERIHVNLLYGIQHNYNGLQSLLDNLANVFSMFQKALPEDDEHLPIYPERGAEGAAYSEATVYEAQARLQGVLQEAKIALVLFKAGLTREQQNVIQLGASCDFLQGGSAEKRILALSRPVPQEDDQDQEHLSVHNDEEEGEGDNRRNNLENGNIEISSVNAEEARVSSPANFRRSSPVPSLSTKSEGKTKRFMKKKLGIEKMLAQLESNEGCHTDVLKSAAADLKEDLKDLKVDQHIDEFDNEPDFLEFFGTDQDGLYDWKMGIEERIRNVRLKAEEQISLRKASTQSGFEKRKKPSFHGDVLNYYEFKNKWLQEVGPERKPEHIEISELKESLPQLAKNKLSEVDQLSEAWSLLDREYGDRKVIRAKLKAKIVNIKIKALSSPEKEIEIFNEIQHISSKIRAAGGQNQLENDDEYVALILRFLTPEQIKEWVRKKNKDWSSFFNFLSELAEEAKEILAYKKTADALGGGDTDDKQKKCAKCGGAHYTKFCRDKKPKTTAVVSSPYTTNCKVCDGAAHTFKGRDGKDRINTKVIYCPSFVVADQQGKEAFIKALKAKTDVCGQCSGIGHKTANCNIKNVSCKSCNKAHLSNICADQKLFTCCSSMISAATRMSVQDVPVQSMFFQAEARVLFDNGSEISLARNEFCQSQGFSYETVNYGLVGVGGNIEEYSSSNGGKLWTVPLINTKGEQEVVKAYGVPDILSVPIGQDKFPGGEKIFPNVNMRAFNALPEKKLDLLVGNSDLGLQPKCAQGIDCPDCAQHRCCYKSKFGLGWVLVGNTQRHGKSSLSHRINTLYRVSLCKVAPNLDSMFFQAEALGVSPVERCSSCKLEIKNCRICSSDRALLSAKEEEEYKILKDNTLFNESTGCLHTKYPFTKALNCQISQEKRQIRNQYHTLYVDQFEDMIKRGVVSEITEEEKKIYKGPVNYITHHEVYKPGSTSTPVRLVSNSSFKNGDSNLNDCLVKGPNTLADIFENLVKFRSYEVGLVFDFTKAYNSLKTGLVERHTRRMWMRPSPDKPWKEYGMNTVQFGDKPAAALMTIAVQKASESYEEIAAKLDLPVDEVKKDASKLLLDTYVDDGTTGGSPEEVSRMQGHLLPSGQFSGTIPSMVTSVGLKLKTMVRSGSTDEDAIAKLSGTVLGHIWEPTKDVFGVSIKFNYSKKKKGKRDKPDISLKDIGEFKGFQHNRRSLLAVCNGIYDPLGLCTPYTIKLKLLMKDTLNVENPGDWDSPVSKKLIDEWAETIAEGVQEDVLHFNRSCTPPNPVKLPRLVGFWDGSTQAFSAVLYIIWMCHKDTLLKTSHLQRGDIQDLDFDPNLHVFTSSIICAKARVTPLKTGLTVPRSELNSLVLCSRLQDKISKLYSTSFGSISTIGDSTCVISAMERNATSFNPFFHARISEIRSLRSSMEDSPAELEEIHHVASADNAADICTRREGKLTNLGLGSSWQSGPAWLRQPRHAWPTTREFVPSPLPSEETKEPIRIVSVTLPAKDTNNWIRYVLEDSNTFTQASHKLASAIHEVQKLKSRRQGLFQPTFQEALSRADSLIFESAMEETDILLSKGQLLNLDIQTKEGINRTLHVTTGRFGKEGVKALYDKEALPVISASSKVAQLILRDCHQGSNNLNHRKAEDALARSRRFAYIVKGYTAAKQVCSSCPKCKLIQARTLSQKIGTIAVDRLKASPPFSSVSADLSGPLLVKQLGARQPSKGTHKIWVIIYLCNVSKAVHLQVVESFSGDSLVTALDNIFARRNLPSHITTDAGKSFTKARRTLQSTEDQIQGFSEEHQAFLKAKWPQLRWSILPPGAHHRVGGPEHMVKMVKRSLRYLPSSQLSLLELDCVLQQIAASINNRPLGFLHSQENILTPNQLLLGRCQDSILPIHNVGDLSVLSLQSFVKAVYKDWFVRWESYVLPRLFENPKKWNKAMPGLSVGDICLLHQPQGTKHRHTSYKYCRVVDLHKARDKNTRTVDVQYYNLPSKKGKTTTVDIRRLTLLPDAGRVGAVST